MLNEIIDGISRALAGEYPGYSIYIDEIKQGLNPPCFLIVNLMNTEVKKLGDRYWREHSFDIHYFPQRQTKPAREAATVGDTLLMVLEYITANEALIRGTDMRHELIDDVLHFFVNYNVFIRKLKDPAPAMETLGHGQRVKGG
jgi:hypothetical protein